MQMVKVKQTSDVEHTGLHKTSPYYPLHFIFPAIVLQSYVHFWNGKILPCCVYRAICYNIHHSLDLTDFPFVFIFHLCKILYIVTSTGIHLLLAKFKRDISADAGKSRAMR